MTRYALCEMSGFPLDYPLCEVSEMPSDWIETTRPITIKSAARYDRNADTGHSFSTYAWAERIHGGLKLSVDGDASPMIEPKVADALMAAWGIQKPEDLIGITMEGVYVQSPTHRGSLLTEKLVALEI